MFVFIAIVSVAAVVVNEQELVAIAPATLGLALTMLIQLSGLFQYGIRQVSTHYLCKFILYQQQNQLTTSPALFFFHIECRDSQSVCVSRTCNGIQLVAFRGRPHNPI